LYLVSGIWYLVYINIYSEEEVRLERQKARLGEDGLRRKKEIIDAAIASQTLPSTEVISSQTLPSTEVITSQTLPSKEVIASQTLPSTEVITSQTLPSTEVITSQTLPSI